MNTSTNLEANAGNISNKRMLYFFLWIFIIDLLFYSEKMGLNALVLVLTSIPIFLLDQPRLLTKPSWWIAMIIWLFTGMGVFVTGSPVSIFAFFVSFFHLAAVSGHYKISMFNSWLQTIPSFVVGMITMFVRIGLYFKVGSNKGNNWLRNILTYSIPLVIIIVFLKLYQAADKDFYELTEFINLDFISWGSIMMYILLSILLFGFYFFQHIKDLNELEDRLPLKININYSDKVQDYFGIPNEARIATIILVCLNLLLVLYNILDVKFITTEMHNPNSDATLSEVVHAGIYALIASIVLVILIITYLFRGQLNFQHNKVLKPLVFIWLAQNLFMIVTTTIKNWEYVEFWGLTYKRLGVFIYLFLAVIGLVLTAHKVIRKKSFWSLLRTTSLTFAFFLTALLTFNWNRAIAHYNTNHVADQRIDFQYLYDLGPDTFSFILHYQNEHGTVAPSLISLIKERVPAKLLHLQEQDQEYTWRSVTWSDYQLQRELPQYNFIQPEKTNTQNYEYR